MEYRDIIVQTVFWVFGFLFLFRIPRCQRSSGEVGSYPPVSVIIPVRNEERSLPVLLSSLRDEVRPEDEIIVVVSPSEDRTLEVAERSNVNVIRSEPLPDGWIGKSWACFQGAQAARGDILVFLDADTRLERNGLKSILDTYLKRGGVVSVQPYHTMKKLYEHLSALFAIIGMAGMGNCTVFGSLVKPLGLFGPCIVIGRERYLESGGHEQVKGEVVEDLALGKRLKKQNIPIHCYGGKDTISFRMYPNGIRELIDGWSKGFATGAVMTYVPILLAIVAWVGGGTSATAYLVEAVCSMNATRILVSAAAYLGYVIQIYWMLFRLGTFRPYTAIFYPIYLLFFFSIFFYSIYTIFVRRTVRWKGQSIRLQDRGRNR